MTAGARTTTGRLAVDAKAAKGIRIVALPPEAAGFQGTRAGLVTRSVAAAIDLAVVLLALTVGYLTVAACLFLWNARHFHMPRPSFTVVLIIGEVLLTSYLAVCWATTGRTYGDRLLALRVVNRHGKRLSVVGAVVRAVFYCVVPLGLFWTAISRENRSLQDVALRTSVIHDWRTGALVPHQSGELVPLLPSDA